LVQLKVTGNLDSSQGGSLRDSPEHRGASGGCHTHVFGTSPEVSESASLHGEFSVLNHKVAELGVSRGSAETVDSSVVTNLNVQVVVTSFEHESVSSSAPLTVPCGFVSTVLGENSVDISLS